MDNFLRGCRIAGDKQFLGARKLNEDKKPEDQFTWLTYNEVRTRAEHFGSGLLNLTGCQPGNEQNVGIYSSNCPDWIVSEFGVMFFNMVFVPLYNTLGDEAMRFIVDQAELSVVILDHVKSLNTFVKDVVGTEEGKNLKFIVMFDVNGVDEQLTQKLSESRIKIFSMDEIVNSGVSNPRELVLPTENDIAVINYTSGTTGHPKGVLLTHKNMYASATGCKFQIPKKVSFRQSDVWFSYLPLPHVFERLVQIAIIEEGASIGFITNGDIRHMASDLSILKPTLFGGVPKVYQRFYDKLMAARSESWIAGKIVNLAVSSKVSDLKSGEISKSTIWDKLVFKKIQDGLGGRVRVCFIGAAPISEDVLNVLRVALGCMIYNGYGQTECSGAACASSWKDATVGTAPLVCNELKLVDVPDMKYFSKDDKGEVQR